MGKQNDFELPDKLAGRIYNTAVVIDYFTERNIDELYNLTLIMTSLRQDTDMVNAYFIIYPDTKNF